MTGFYRNVLQMRERSNVDDIKLTDEQLAEIQQEALLKEQEEQGRLNTAIQAGVVAINDSGEVVDKRQQLMGGLNISSVKIKAIEREKEASEKIIRERREKERQEARLREEEEDRRRRLREQQQRARNMVQEQQSDLERQQQQVKEREKEDLARKMAKKATEDTISDAKARYLARKKEGGISKRNDDDSSSSDSE